MKQQLLCSWHMVLIICCLTSLTWGGSCACNCFTFPWTFLQPLWLLGQVWVFSCAKSPGLCRIPTPPTLEAIGTDTDFSQSSWAPAQACEFQLIFVLLHFICFLFPSACSVDFKLLCQTWRQQPCSWVRHFKRPKLNMPEFGVKESLLIKKAPTEKMGDLIMSQIHLAHWRRLRNFKGVGETIMQKCWWVKF